MKNFTFFLFIILGAHVGISQNSITGKISDFQSVGLPYANVILYKTDNSSPKGTISDDNGNFRFENINPGRYKIEVSMLGFETKKIAEFFLNQNKTLVITLQEENQTLDEVVVTASRPVIRQTAEKLIVDLEKTELLNSSLQDIMRKVPGVLVTDSGISIAGKGGIRILINGKTTEYMDVEALLRDFPADNIAKVEVVEQPGSEYDASGSGAIVNIILKKNMRLGTHGSLMGWIGEDDSFEYGTSASIASYKNKFNLTFQGQPFFTVGYSNTADVLFNLIKQDNSTAQIRQQIVNVEDFTNWNFRLFAPLSIIKSLEGYTGFIVNKNTYTSSLQGVDLSKWSMFWFIQANYKLPWDVNFELNGNYGTGALEGQIEVDWLAGLDFSFGRRFLEDKLKVNLGFNKMLNRGFNGSIDYGNGTAQVESNGSRQNIQLRLTYSFGSKFGKKKNNRNASEDEENRIDSNN